jgi:hypothetical protein
MWHKAKDKLCKAPAQNRPVGIGNATAGKWMRSLRRWSFFIGLFFIPFRAFPASDFMADTAAMRSVRQAIQHIYNLEFNDAEPIIGQLERGYPSYPGIQVLRSFYLYWKHRPIRSGTAPFDAFESALRKGLEQSLDMLSRDQADPEATFFAMASRAYLALLYVENGMNMKALMEAKGAYGFLKRGFELTGQNPEFYFSSGIYQYYRVKFPEENPFYKPFMWFFASGDKTKGLQMLRKGSEVGIFTRVECMNYLWNILLHYEYQPLMAQHYAERLHKSFPDNLFFTANYAETLVEMMDLRQVLPLARSLQASEVPFYQYLGHLYHGNYLELYSGDKRSARTAYEKALRLGAEKNAFTPHHNSLLQAGLGRVETALGQTQKARSWFQQGLKSAEYSYMRDKIQKELDALR